MPANLNSFYKTFLASLDAGEAALFIGAGMSRASGFVDWKGLLRDIATDIGLDVDEEHDLVALAQYHLNAKRNRATLNRKLIEEFTRDAKASLNHELIALLPIKTVWTTNYDTLIEDAFTAAEKKPAVKSTQANLAQSFPGHDVSIYKMHGDISQPHEAVLTKHDYEMYSRKRGLFIESLQGDLVDKTFLFMGFSFTDPNIEYVLSRLHVFLEQNTREHFCIIKKPEASSGRGKKNYDLPRHQLRVEDLKRYGITTIEVDAYSEITDILRELNRRGHRRDVFVSGSAAEYSTPFDRDRLESLARRIGEQIIEKDRNLVSGFGFGIGSSVIMGAIETLYRKSRAHQEGRTNLRPFPQTLPETMTREEFTKKHRSDIVAQSGAVIFISGNKMLDGAIANAPGVIEEFKLASDRKLPVIPIGATGYAAKELWQTVSAAPDKYFSAPAKVQKPLAVLGDESKTNDELIAAVFEILDIEAAI